MNSDTAEEKSKSNEPPTAGALGLVNVLYKDPNAAATAVKESYGKQFCFIPRSDWSKLGGIWFG